MYGLMWGRAEGDGLNTSMPSMRPSPSPSRQAIKKQLRNVGQEESGTGGRRRRDGAGKKT